MDGLNQMVLIGISAVAFIAIFKLAMAFAPVPYLRDVAAFI